MSLGWAEDKHSLSYGLHHSCQGIDEHQHPIRMVAKLGANDAKDVVRNYASKSDDKQDIVEIKPVRGIKLQLAHLSDFKSPPKESK